MVVCLEPTEHLILVIRVVTDKFPKIHMFLDNLNKKSLHCRPARATPYLFMFKQGTEPRLKQRTKNLQILSSLTDFLNVTTNN